VNTFSILLSHCKYHVSVIFMASPEKWNS